MFRTILVGVSGLFAVGVVYNRMTQAQQPSLQNDTFIPPAPRIQPPMQHSTREITHKLILGKDYNSFIAARDSGFKTKDILNLTTEWFRGDHEKQLQVIADAILSHYEHNDGFARQFSELLKELKDTKKSSASYRLGKILSSWLHQRWTALPCSALSSDLAYELFPHHALHTPKSPPIKIFKCEIINSFGDKKLNRPTEWEGALDAFTPILELVPKPNKITVIGYGDARELIVLKKKWPDAIIHAFEQSPDREEKPQIEAIKTDPNISIHYEKCPVTYKHANHLIDLAVIRHPNLGSDWISVVLKAINSLSPNGTLLMTFYSEKEMRYFKNLFLKHRGSEYNWSEKVNPHAYNPSFMSASGTYSFDLLLVTISPRSSIHADLLARLAVSQTRKQEESPIEVKESLRQSKL